jgi:PilZ domain
VSMGGMAAYIAAELVMGETIELDVTLPYSTCALRLRVVVRSRRGYQYGVEYVNVTSASSAAIQRACASLALVQ